MAFVCVFLCHALPFTTTKHEDTLHGNAWLALQYLRETGNFGVSLFFVLSGYIITELLRREIETTGGINLKFFYVRRILRIWPLYFFILTLSGILGMAIPIFHIKYSQVLANLLFAGNWYIFAHPASAISLSYLWSVSIEEQFYIVWPVMFKIAGRAYSRVAAWTAVCIPLAIVAIVATVSLTAHHDITVWMNSLVHFQFVALGGIMSFGLKGRTPTLSARKRLWFIVIGAASWLTANTVCKIKVPDTSAGASQMCVGYELVAVGCALLLLSTLGISEDRIPRLVVYLGKISYGLYVYHGIALFVTTEIRKREFVVTANSLPIYAADRLAALILTVLFAAISYRFLEVPFLRLKERFAVVGSRSV